MSLHWPVYPYSLSAISNFLCILLPHWPGILTCLRVWGTWYLGEPQISLLGTCCCSSSVCSNFLLFFCLPFHYLLSREICVLSLSLLLSSPCSPPFSEGVGWLFFQEHLAWNFWSPASIMLGLQECITSLGSTHLFAEDIPSVKENLCLLRL